MRGWRPVVDGHAGVRHLKDGQPLLTNLKTYVLDGGKQSSNYFFSLAKDNRGQWWFGNRGKGLYTLEHNTLKFYPRMQNTADPSIYDVYALLPVGDDLWVGSGMGISILHQDGSIKRITMADATTPYMRWPAGAVKKCGHRATTAWWLSPPTGT